MSFAQVTGHESSRKIEACLRTAGPNLYHAGDESSCLKPTKFATDQQLQPVATDDCTPGLLAGRSNCSSNGSTSTYESNPFFGTTPNAFKTQVWGAVSI